VWTFWESKWRARLFLGVQARGAVKSLNEEGAVAAVLLILGTQLDISKRRGCSWFFGSPQLHVDNTPFKVNNAVGMSDTAYKYSKAG